MLSGYSMVSNCEKRGRGVLSGHSMVSNCEKRGGVCCQVIVW